MRSALSPWPQVCDSGGASEPVLDSDRNQSYIWIFLCRFVLLVRAVTVTVWSPGAGGVRFGYVISWTWRWEESDDCDSVLVACLVPSVTGVSRATSVDEFCFIRDFGRKQAPNGRDDSLACRWMDFRVICSES
jgi:hypothetical protein